MTAMRHTAIPPGPGSPLGFASWAREMRAMAACMVRAPCAATGDVAQGDGHAVLVLPGFLTGDWTTRPLRGFLAANGFQAVAARLLFNAGPTKRIIGGLSDRLAALADATGRRVSLVGQSLGGVFARGLAQRRPDHVRRVVTLCSPIRFPVETPLAPFARALSVFHDPDWTAQAGDIAGPPPAPVTALYSCIDGIVDWRQCLQDERPGYDNVRIDAPHTTIASHPQAQRIVAARLALPG